MGTTRPANVDRNANTEANPPEALFITYLLKHPTRGVDGIAFAEVAAKRGLTREEFWLQVMQRNFNQLLESNADGRSMLDDIFSEALGEPVTVWEVEATIELHADRKLPGLIIQSQKVVDPLGRSAAHELAHWEILSRIATALMDFTRADWAIFSIGDGKSEFLLPLLREVKKEEADDA